MRKIACPIALILLSGCNAADRLSRIGAAPPLTQISNPQHTQQACPIIMPTPRARVAHRGENSLWQSGARAFFKDQRARDVGDLLTISVDLNETANMDNNTKHSRASTQGLGIKNLGFTAQKLTSMLPEGMDPTHLLDLSSDPGHEGKGRVKRTEKLSFKVAAVVTQVLPNGNLVIAGRQEIRVNFEVRDITITGIIRAEDISANNTIDSTKIAEARMSYGGRGQLTDMQQAPWGHQLIGAISPF